MCKDIPCVKACPTGALSPALTGISDARMGIAVVDPASCLSHQGLRCEVCYRACPEEGEGAHDRKCIRAASAVTRCSSRSCTPSTARAVACARKSCPTGTPAIRIADRKAVARRDRRVTTASAGYPTMIRRTGVGTPPQNAPSRLPPRAQAASTTSMRMRYEAALPTCVGRLSAAHFSLRCSGSLVGTAASGGRSRASLSLDGSALPASEVAGTIPLSDRLRPSRGLAAGHMPTLTAGLRALTRPRALQPGLAHFCGWICPMNMVARRRRVASRSPESSRPTSCASRTRSATAFSPPRLILSAATGTAAFEAVSRRPESGVISSSATGLRSAFSAASRGLRARPCAHEARAGAVTSARSAPSGRSSVA